MRSTSVTSTLTLRRARGAASPPNPPPTITIWRRGAWSPGMDGLRGRDGGAEPLEQVVADAQGVGHRRQRRVHGADAREEARVDDVEVVHLMGAAVRVHHRGGL